ncbi:hypothetical protein [Streptomyces sp. YPW6]|uniref:hypothetical protein n=1 Tax=Streptomyces sp. YPW6 TaxID=2840373 RepID=UPI003EBE8F17
MALIDFFTRKPAAPAPPAEAPEPKAWPEIGETWKPEGLAPTRTPPGTCCAPG